MADDPFAHRSNPSAETASEPVRKDWRRFVPVGVLLAGVVLGYTLGWHRSISLQGLAENGSILKQQVADNPIAAPFVFIAFYTLAVAMSFPAVAVLKVIGGFLFGWLAGAVYIVIAATLGGALLFLSVRTAFGGFLRNRAGKRVGKLAREFENDAFSYVLMMRLAPFVPFVVASIAPALFDVRLKTYLAASSIGIVPGAICFAWVGQGLGAVMEEAEAAGRPIAVSDLITTEITLALLALTLVAVLATIVRRVRGTQPH